MKKMREIESNQVFIHRSIKTRIETVSNNKSSKHKGVFIHRSIKTRIETLIGFQILQVKGLVFIHRSIKTRIETNS